MKGDVRVTTSMTGFASGTGAALGYRWAWDLRSVNARGLDLRLRVPDWVSGLEQGLRARLPKAANRGAINLSLRLTREESGSAVALDSAALDAVLDALTEVETRAMDRGLTLAPSSAQGLLALRGVLEASASDDPETAPLLAALLDDFEGVVTAFVEMRKAEGAALHGVLAEALTRIAELAADARRIAAERRGDMDDAFRASLARVTDAVDVDPDRIAQELAVLAVKSDITEELDRLDAHVVAARELLAQEGPVGRKLDFLMQEFNREANTLCSKSQHSGLTSVGLELKVVIDQLREQVQNVE
ncbi:hypothetical protein ATO11_03260 [Pseudaestuariivita atlantica]|uniref:YicC family protein n=2 Tax=Pseudaestuariivita atlantica TaxID=1317121 RepID=A0A0L1JVB7_9RHOB|nr:hypothetical protein ATO11_03260 [Pseudaestuariivita atlantica]